MQIAFYIPLSLVKICYARFNCAAREVFCLLYILTREINSFVVPVSSASSVDFVEALKCCSFDGFQEESIKRKVDHLIVKRSRS